MPNFVEIYFEIFLLFEVTIPNAKIYLSSTVVRIIWDGLMYTMHIDKVVIVDPRAGRVQLLIYMLRAFENCKNVAQKLPS